MRISLTSTPSRCSSAYITALAMSSSCSAHSPGRLSKNGVSVIPGSVRVTLVSWVLWLWGRLARRGAPPLADRRRRPLGRRVERAGQGPPAGHRAGDEEVAIAALEQVGEGGADRQGDAVDVGQHHRAPVLRRLLEEAAGRAEARVGKDRVDAVEGVERRGGHRLD